MPRTTPPIPSWIRDFAYPGYVNVYSLASLRDEPKLFCTETLLGDWDASVLFYAKDAAPVTEIVRRIGSNDSNPWRHGERGSDRMGYRTNEKVADLATYFSGTKLYGSALAHMLKADNRASSSLAGLTSGQLHDHLKRVLDFVVQNMPNLKAIVCLGCEAHKLVSACSDSRTAAKLSMGACVEISLFSRPVLMGRLYHPSRPFAGGWAARDVEWQSVADCVNRRIDDHP